MRKHLLHKKAIMGIETLIIFIAMIVVASIAAGVLLRTQGLLQQRSLAVGNEARERIITGVELVSIVGNRNSQNNTMNQIELTARLRSGSGDVDLKTLGMTFTTRDFSTQLALQSTLMGHSRRYNITALTAVNQSTQINFDNDPTDFSNDVIRLLVGNQSPDNLSGLDIHLTTGSQIIFPLGINLSSPNTTINITHLPIRRNYYSNYSQINGFITLVGTTNGSPVLGTSANFTTAYIESDIDSCQWTDLIPDFRYCQQARLGNNNVIVEQGELLVLRILLSDGKGLNQDETIEIRIVPKGGAIEEITFVTPSVMSRAIMTLWP